MTAPLTPDQVQPLTDASIEVLNDAICIYWDVDHRKSRIPSNRLALIEGFQPNFLQRIQAVYNDWEITYDEESYIFRPLNRPLPPPKPSPKQPIPPHILFDLLNTILTKKIGLSTKVEVRWTEILEEIHRSTTPLVKSLLERRRSHLTDAFMGVLPSYEKVGWICHSYLSTAHDPFHRSDEQLLEYITFTEQGVLRP